MTYSGLKASFDAVATVYDAVRPSYPDALIQAVIDLTKLPAAGRILEIGCGTGQATLPFASRGYSMLCLEPGRNLAAKATQNLRAYPSVTIQTVTFEDWPLEMEAFDLVISAQAFHWIPAEIGYPKALQALKPTGSIALFWNLSPGPEGDLWNDIQQAYVACAPQMGQHGDNRPEAKVHALEEQMSTHCQHPIQGTGNRTEGEKGRKGAIRSIDNRQSSIDYTRHLTPDTLLFRDMMVKQFPWSVRYDTAQYIDLLNTYSDHLALPDINRKCLYDRITRTIDKHGGSLLKPYLSLLLIAQKQGVGYGV